MDNHVSDNQAKDLADRTKATASNLAGTASDFAGKAKTRVEELAGQANTIAGNAYDQARTQARDAAATVAKTVEEQPLTALLIGGLICGVVGYLLARR
jgi:ElaB/YqjD/DUF883 family membrane-anchored ribosome-binding protein